MKIDIPGAQLHPAELVESASDYRSMNQDEHLRIIRVLAEQQDIVRGMAGLFAPADQIDDTYGLPS